MDPSIAIVVDPKRTMAAGKVEIACFRTYRDQYAEELLKKEGQAGGGSSVAIPQEKIQDFGLYAHKYYKIEHTFFKSSLDADILHRLWNQYWTHTLSSSPLLSNQDFICKSIVNVV